MGNSACYQIECRIPLVSSPRYQTGQFMAGYISWSIAHHEVIPALKQWIFPEELPQLISTMFHQWFSSPGEQNWVYSLRIAQYWIPSIYNSWTNSHLTFHTERDNIGQWMITFILYGMLFPTSGNPSLIWNSFTISTFPSINTRSLVTRNSAGPAHKYYCC